MSVTGIGDMALHFMLGRQNTRLNEELTSLTTMLSTGEVLDKANPVTGDYFVLGDIERSTRLLDAYDTATTEAGIFLSTAQAALASVQDSAQSLASDLMTAAQSGTGAGLNVAGQNARDAFLGIVSNLNATATGRAVFAGSGTDGAALADGDAILTALAATLSGETTAAGIKAGIEAWFMDAGGGFEASGYAGETGSLAPFQLDRGTSAQFEVRADRAEIREVLVQVATAAFATDEGFGLSLSEQQGLLQDAGEGLLARLDGLTELRAETGALEERVETAEVRNASARASLEISRADIVGADPYDTATRLQSTQTQLELLYTATARLSQLTLAKYLG